MMLMRGWRGDTKFLIELTESFKYYDEKSYHFSKVQKSIIYNCIYMQLNCSGVFSTKINFICLTCFSLDSPNSSMTFRESLFILKLTRNLPWEVHTKTECRSVEPLMLLASPPFAGELFVENIVHLCKTCYIYSAIHAIFTFQCAKMVTKC